MKAVLPERQDSPGARYTLKYQFHSRLILVDVDGKKTAEKLLATKKLGNIPVKVDVHKTKNTIKGTILTSNFHDMTDAEFLERLIPQGVLDVFNVPKRDKSGKSARYFLTFAGNKLPDKILAEGLVLKVKAPNNSPRRCPKCQEFGHGEKTCVKAKICCKCGKQADHDYSDCPNETCCSNCGQGHAASAPECPLFQIEAAVIRHQESTQTDPNSARQYIIQTHALVNQIPKLRNKRATLPVTAAAVVGRNNNARPTQPNIPQRQTNQPDLAQIIKPLENQITKQSNMIAEQARTIDTLRTCMLGMINAPSLRLGFDGSLVALEDSGVIDKAQHSSVLNLLSKTVDETTGTRKSRSRSRRPSSKSRQKSRSKSKKTPPRNPNAMESQPSTPTRGAKRRYPLKDSSSSPQENSDPGDIPAGKSHRVTTSPASAAEKIQSDPVDYSSSKVTDLSLSSSAALPPAIPKPKQGLDQKSIKSAPPPPLPPSAATGGLVLTPQNLDNRLSPVIHTKDDNGVPRRICRTSFSKT